MTYRKGSWPDLSTICMSVFFFSFSFFLGFCYNLWKSIRGCFPITPYRTVVPAVWASPSVSAGGAPWFSGLGIKTQYSLSLSLTLCLLFSQTQSSLRGRFVFYFGGSPPPPNNTCTTDECRAREGGWDFIILCTPQSNMRPPGQTPTAQWRKLTGKVFMLQVRWDYYRLFISRIKIQEMMLKISISLWVLYLQYNVWSVV